MSQIRIILSLIGVALLLAPPPASAYTITLEKKDIQDQIAPNFPVTESNFLSSVTLKNPRVDLTEGSDRIGLIVDAAVVALGGYEAEGLVHIDGTLRFVRENMEFFLQDATARSVDIAGVSEEARVKIAELVTIVIRDYFQTNPIYRLKPESMSESVIMGAIKSVKIKDGKLLVNLGMP